MLDRLTYWLALGVITMIRRLPLAVCFVVGQLVGAVLWAILPRYRKLARENLSTAFAELTPGQIRSLIFRHFITLGANGVCAFKIDSSHRNHPTYCPAREQRRDQEEDSQRPRSGGLMRQFF
jgi:lauroyl/myristoyl acyltransferase